MKPINRGGIIKPQQPVLDWINHGLTLTRPTWLGELVALGEMSIHGSLLKVPALAERLKLAMGNGAKRVLIPSENKRDFADIPSDVLDKLQIIFFSDPVNAAFRAMGLE